MESAVLAKKEAPAEMSGGEREQQGAFASEPRRPGGSDNESRHEKEGSCMEADAD